MVGVREPPQERTRPGLWQDHNNYFNISHHVVFNVVRARSSAWMMGSPTMDTRINTHSRLEGSA